MTTRSVEIPEAAVEAAAQAIWEHDGPPEFAWPPSEEVCDDAEANRRLARAALSAALPYLAPAGDGGLREALERLVPEYELRAIDAKTDEEGRAYMQARRELRAVLAAHPAAPAVPQPAAGSGWFAPETDEDRRELAAERQRLEAEESAVPQPAGEDEWPDELEPFVAEQMKNPAFAAAYATELAKSAGPQPVDREALTDAVESALDSHAYDNVPVHKIVDAVLAVLAGGES